MVRAFCHGAMGLNTFYLRLARCSSVVRAFCPGAMGLNTFYLRLARCSSVVRAFSPGAMGLNTFYLRLYGVRHMVMDHSDSEKGNPLRHMGLLFPISSKDYFICHNPQTG